MIADVHLGYEWARAAGGDCLPSHSLAETLAKLASLLAGRPSPGWSWPATWWSRRSLAGGRRRTSVACSSGSSDRGVELIPVLGNHDPQGPKAPPFSVEVAGWTDRPRPPADPRPRRLISGPSSPGLACRWVDGARASWSARRRSSCRPSPPTPPACPSARPARPANGWSTTSGASPAWTTSSSTSDPCRSWWQRSGGRGSRQQRGMHCLPAACCLLPATCCLLPATSPTASRGTRRPKGHPTARRPARRRRSGLRE